MERKPTKPKEPKKPSETMEGWVDVWEGSGGISLSDLLEKAPAGVEYEDLHVSAGAGDEYDEYEEYYDGYIYLTQRTIVPNPRYKKLKEKYDAAMEAYPKKLAEYERKCIEWEEIKKNKKKPDPKWYPIELFEKDEVAVVWHMCKLMLVDKDNKIREDMPSVRLTRGDELYIVEGVKELYDGASEPPTLPDGKSPGGIYYTVVFRSSLRGKVFSGAIKHKDNKKNIGQRMHSQQGWTI